ncbi:dephospho-CoA kinase [Dolosigranulum pigrum]|jgi:dephospho-coA kinase|uniref:dephospho-CoA kinase n=1 Tax=Dolosigranulum pigrum TaxID=29394 RepID=UPI000DBFF098|nr:dephospho-CoA kinase [Dolosigranulum pigrum]RAN50816.1 dephospho-CoA kinase [Dolosigranulum pigrum]
MTTIIGLTGGIATGKSTVTNYLRAQEIPVIDADDLSHRVVQPGEPGLALIKEHFGPHVILDTGELDRKALGKIIFGDKVQRQQLNELLHPLIAAEMDREIARLKQQGEMLIVLDIPLLFETDFGEKVDEVLVVYTPESVQLERLMTRDELSRTDAESRIQAQLSIEEKCCRADYVIDNSGSRAQTIQQVTEWLQIRSELGFNG